MLRYLESEHDIYIDSLEYRYDDIKDLIPNRNQNPDPSQHREDYSRNDNLLSPRLPRRDRSASAPSAGVPQSPNRDRPSPNTRAPPPKFSGKSKASHDTSQKLPKTQLVKGSSPNDFDMDERPGNSGSSVTVDDDSRSQESTGLPTPTNTIMSIESPRSRIS